MSDKMSGATSDGVTEAMDRDGEGFGELRLIASLKELQSLVLSILLTRVVSSVQEFTKGIQWDDLTLVMARPS